MIKTPVQAACARAGITRDQLSEKGRQREGAMRRFKVFTILHREHKFSLPRIGQLTGLEHSSVYHGITEYEKMEAIIRSDDMKEAAE